MGKPYSMDRRERAVAAVSREGLSRHESAARFGVAPSTVIKLGTACSADGERRA
jgi:putative transposase